MEITYDYYRIFYYVAKYRSFSKAARVLMRNQPNITKVINNLEEQLGCRLFIRSNRGAELTPEGERLYAHISIAYEQIRAAEIELANEKSLQSGRISIGASETALHGILLPVLKDFHSAYPGARLCIYNHSTPQAIQALKNGIIDFAVVTSPTDIGKPFKETALKEFREIMAGSNQYSFLMSKAHKLSELLQYPLICLGRNTATYEFYSRLFMQHRLILQPDMEAATADQLLPMIKAGLGIGFIPENFALEAMERGEVFNIPLADKIPNRTICLVEDTSRKLSIAAAALKQILLNSVGKL